jgi:Flp pilus assembly protein TadD
MGRSRRRRRQTGNGGNGDNGQAPEAGAPESVVTETLAPTYVPMKSDRPLVVAPVLELEGLDPWSEIAGPALALEEGSEDGAVEFDDPAQLVLAPAGPTFVQASERPAAPAETPPDVTPELALAPLATAQPTEVPPTAAAPKPQPAPPALEAVEVTAAEAEPPPPPPPPPPPAPDPIEVLYAEARTAAEAGRSDDAKTLYRQLLALHPAHVRARNNLALLLDAEGNHQGALAELDRALDVEAENGTLLVNRGALLGAMGRFAAAERDLKKVLRVEPAHAEALFNLGVVMTKKGLWSEAVPHLKRAVELEPQRAAAHYYLGEALNHVDDLPGALAAYQRVTELQPNNPRALYGLGIIYDRLARPDDAAQMYRRSREVGRR